MPRAQSHRIARATIDKLANQILPPFELAGVAS